MNAILEKPKLPRAGKLTLGGIIPAPETVSVVEKVEVDKPKKNRDAKNGNRHQDSPVVMTTEQLREALKDLGCNALTLGRVLGANERTARRWISGDLMIPPAVAVLIRLVVAVARDTPYSDIVTKLRSEAGHLQAWEDERLSRIAAKAAQG